MEDGFRCYQTGQLAEAEWFFRQVLAVDPRHADALHLLGLIAHRVGQNEKAVEFIDKAIEITPSAAAYHSNKGCALQELGRLDEAIASFDTAILLKPDYASAHYNKGNALKEQGHDEDAIVAYNAALRLEPGYPEAYANKGNALQKLGRLEDAIVAFNNAIRIEPDAADTHHHLGAILYSLGRLDESIMAYNNAVRLKPDYAEAYFNLGRALKDRGCLDEAVAAYNNVIRCKPDDAEAYSDLGVILRDLRRLADAVAVYNVAIRLKPDYAEAHSNLGAALKDLGHLADAAAAFNAALRFKPDLAEAHYNLGVVLHDLGQRDGSISALNTALRLKPDYPEAHSNLVMCLYYQPGNDEDSILKATRRFADQIVAKPRASFMNAAEPRRRLRIGYVSADLRSHPVGYFLSPVLPNHDPDAVEIYCYSNSRDEDDVTAKLRGAAHHWRSLVGLPDDKAAAQIIADGIDILVDLSGYTGGNRLVMFAGRAAPVQATWLGFWGTTGLSTMDYILSDEDTIPPEQERFYSERVLRLPGSRFCYEAPDYAPQPVAPPSLAGGGVTFGSFNNLTKVGPEVIRLWAQVLHAVPDSQLCLKWKSLADEGTRQQLTSDFAAAGIGLDRLILRGQSPHEVMLKEYGDIDIALDPFPFSGGLTSCEALWMGLPVVTLPGTEAVSRQTLGFLRAIERTEWAASSPEDYIRIAASLAADKGGLAALRAGQRQRMASSPLCDGKSFARQVEAAYRSMWQNWCQTTQSERSDPADDRVTSP
jgi:predicted O-linked N-acetylglucosamine transferase (SPINDLY family)